MFHIEEKNRYKINDSEEYYFFNSCLAFSPKMIYW